MMFQYTTVTLLCTLKITKMLHSNLVVANCIVHVECMYMLTVDNIILRLLMYAK